MSRKSEPKAVKRLFIGSMLPLAEAELIEDLRQAIEPTLQDWWQCKLRWVRPEKLHITWLFLGDCDAEQEKSIAESLSSIAPDLKKAEIDYSKFSVFGSHGRSTAVVFLPERINAEVESLGAELRKKLGKFCEKKQDFEFQPHLTIFRFPRDSRTKYQIQPGLDLSKYLPMHQDISKISLIESHTGADGIDYKILGDFPLS